MMLKARPPKPVIPASGTARVLHPRQPPALQLISPPARWRSPAWSRIRFWHHGSQLLNRLRRSACAQEGAVTIPTLFWIPVFFFILLAGVEMMVINMRQVLLSRAVDMATRELRLGPAELPDHDQMKQRICSIIRFVPDCQDNLAVEVFPVDMTTWSLAAAGAPLCTDSSDPDLRDPRARAARGDQLAVLRACLKLTPMTRIDPLARALRLDGGGRFALVETTVFVNEPRQEN